MAITTVDQLVNALQSPTALLKLSRTTVAGQLHGLWTASGNPQAGSTTGALAAAIPISTDTGAIRFTNPSGGRSTYLGGMDAVGTVAGTLMVFDRMLVYGFDGTSSAGQTMSSTATKGGSTVSAAVDRPSGGYGDMYVEMVANGSSARTITVAYTNQAGTGSRSATASVPSTAKAGDLFPVAPLSTSGSVTDVGARSVQTITASGSLGGGTNPTHLVILRKLLSLPIQTANVGALLNYAATRLPQIYDSSALMLAIMPTTTSSGDVHATASLAQG